MNIDRYSPDMVSAESKAEAVSRLDRAEEFLSFARIAEGDPAYSNSIVSLSAQAAVAASDAALAANEVTRASRAQHGDAAKSLRGVGLDAMAKLLDRLLRLKPKAQYSAGETCTLNDATNALSWAARIIDLARDECNRRLRR